ncbi:MAG TPA: DapH/DapD/GlmU-related protein [Chloroflexota bacterium]|nr:DapH/DapD/GlmU-related protein [Chloroflexota bacterium]
MISPTARIYPNVLLGENVEIGDFVIVGVPPKGKAEGELPTIIGDGAVIRSHTVIYAGNVIGNGFQSGHHTLIREENRIGNNVSVGSSSVVEHHVEIADRVRIHSQAFVPEFSVLEEGAWIGPNVVLTNAPHPLCPRAKDCLKGPTIKRGAKIGANSTIIPFIVVGEDALVGAGSVVVKDVPDRAVVAGNPARVLKSIDDLTCPVDLIDSPYGGKR